MKKVLIIVYYWPPGGGAGVQRWLKFVKYLPQFGWMPTVVTTKYGDYPAIDESLLDEIPDEIKVIRTKTPTFGGFFKTLCGKKLDVPYGSLEIKKSDNFLKKLLILFRINFIVPDARKLWNKYAVKAAEKELLSNKYEAVITSGPPHSTHLVGLKLKKKFNINWIADFRDPWTKIDYLDRIKRLFITKFLDSKLEKSVVRECDRIITISRKIAEDLNAGDKADVIPNGFDPADFKDIKRKNSKGHFNIDYFGNITIERDPSSILKAVYMLREKGITNIRMSFWGNVSAEMIAKINKLDKNSIVNIHFYIQHNEMLKEMVNSSLLLLVINNVSDNQGILTGKIYEYLAAKVPVLGLGPQDGEAADILLETEAGKMFDYNSIEEITDFIRKKYQNWRERKTFSASNKIDEYSRKKQTKILAKILETKY